MKKNAGCLLTFNQLNQWIPFPPIYLSLFVDTQRISHHSCNMIQQLDSCTNHGWRGDHSDDDGNICTTMILLRRSECVPISHKSGDGGGR